VEEFGLVRSSLAEEGFCEKIVSLCDTFVEEETCCSFLLLFAYLGMGAFWNVPRKETVTIGITAFKD